MGGAQDRDQGRASEDLLATKGPALLKAAGAGTVILAVCGAYQLFGKHYVAASGEQLPGLGLFNCWTEHPGPADDRLIGNVVAELVEPATPSHSHAGASVHPEPATNHPEPVEGWREQPDRPSTSSGWSSITLVGFENHGGRTILGPGRAAARASPLRLRQQRQGWHGGRPLSQRLRHLPARLAAAEEPRLRRPAARPHPRRRRAGAAGRRDRGRRAPGGAEAHRTAALATSRVVGGDWPR